MSKGCHGHKFTEFITFSFHLAYCGGYWKRERDIIVVSLWKYMTEKNAPRWLSQILSHELGHRFCHQEFPKEINKKASSYKSKAWNLQEKMMTLFDDATI